MARSGVFGDGGRVAFLRRQGETKIKALKAINDPSQS